jgi:hypothetical protein
MPCIVARCATVAVLALYRSSVMIVPQGTSPLHPCRAVTNHN